jgi:hypothetical protein
MCGLVFSESRSMAAFAPAKVTAVRRFTSHSPQIRFFRKKNIAMTRLVPSVSAAACLLFGMAAAASGAEPSALAAGVGLPAAQSAAICRKDLHAFSTTMQKGGYWLGESRDGYGYPMDGMGYGYAQPIDADSGTYLSYDQARPR